MYIVHAFIEFYTKKFLYQEKILHFYIIGKVSRHFCSIKVSSALNDIASRAEDATQKKEKKGRFCPQET